MKKLLALIFFYLLLRLPFVANYPHFYDAPEYIREAASSTLQVALSHMHPPMHAIFMIFAFSSYHVFHTVWSISLVAVVMGLIGLVSFYLLLKVLFDEKIALLGTLPLLFFPQLFLIQTNILHDSVDEGFFMAGLALFTVFILRKNIWHLLGGLVALSLSITDYTGMMAWFPLFPFVAACITQQKKKWIFLSMIFLFASIMFSIFMQFGLFAYATGSAVGHIRYILSGSGQSGSFRDLVSLMGVLRAVRDSAVVVWYGYNPLLFLIMPGILMLLIKKRQWVGVGFIGFGLLGFFANMSIWHAGLYGRIGGLVAYSFALSIAFIPKKILYVITAGSFAVLLAITAFHYMQIPIPLMQEKVLAQIALQKSDLLVLSDNQRPQLEEYYPHAVYIGSATVQKVQEKIQQAFLSHQAVYISQEARTAPYFQYDGQEIHILSKGDVSKAYLYPLLKKRRFVYEAGIAQYPLLTIYQVY